MVFAHLGPWPKVWSAEVGFEVREARLVAEPACDGGATLPPRREEVTLPPREEGATLPESEKALCPIRMLRDAAEEEPEERWLDEAALRPGLEPEAML